MLNESRSYTHICIVRLWFWVSFNYFSWSRQSCSSYKSSFLTLMSQHLQQLTSLVWLLMLHMLEVIIIPMFLMPPLHELIMLLLLPMLHFPELIIILMFLNTLHLLLITCIYRCRSDFPCRYYLHAFQSMISKDSTGIGMPSV